MNQPEPFDTLITSARGVYVRLIFIDMCDGNLYDAMMLSQIFYWHLPDEHGVSKLRRFKDGHYWLVKNHGDWEQENRVVASTARKSLTRLKNANLIVYELHGEEGRKAPWIRLNIDEFNRKFKACMEPLLPLSPQDTPLSGEDSPPPSEDEPNTESTEESTESSLRGSGLSIFDLYMQASGQLMTNKNVDDLKDLIEDYGEERVRDVIVYFDPNTITLRKLSLALKRLEVIPQPFKEAVSTVFDIHGTRIWGICHQLNGTATSGDYRKFMIHPPVSVDELHAFKTYYQQKYPGAHLPRTPELINDHLATYRAHVKETVEAEARRNAQTQQDADARAAEAVDHPITGAQAAARKAMLNDALKGAASHD